MLDILANFDTSILTIIIATLAGSYGKDYLRIMQSPKPEKVSITTICLSTVTATIAMYGLADFVADKFGEKMLPFISLIMGLIGFQLLEKLSTIEGVLNLTKQIRGGGANVEDVHTEHEKHSG